MKLEDSNDSESVKKRFERASEKKKRLQTRKTLILIPFCQDFRHARGIHTRAAAKQLLEQSHFLRPQFLCSADSFVPVGHIRRCALKERGSCCLERKMFCKIESLPKPMLYSCNYSMCFACT